MGKPIFKEEISWRDEKYRIEVFDTKDYSKLNDVKQVYGFIFNENGELLIVKCGSNDQWGLPGGGPEKCDKTWKDTLIREVDEEANIEIKNIIPAGYITSTYLGTKKTSAKIGSMIRAVALVKAIKKRAIDPATGVIDKVKFIPVSDFLNYCSWGKNGKAQLEIALRVKEERKD
jgi:8-oxo-dGTP pyrophosphatase MutT (NUDIX family)